VRADVEQWLPKVVEGGVVAFHDTVWHAGVRRVVDRSIYRSRGFKDHRFVVGSTSIARKVAQNSATDRARARYVLGVKTAFWLVSTVLKKQRKLLPKPVERLGRRLVGRVQ